MRKTYINKKSYLIHLQEVCQKPANLACQKCNKRFLKQENLNRNEREILKFMLLITFGKSHKKYFFSGLITKVQETHKYCLEIQRVKNHKVGGPPRNLKCNKQ